MDHFAVPFFLSVRQGSGEESLVFISYRGSRYIADTNEFEGRETRCSVVVDIVDCALATIIKMGLMSINLKLSLDFASYR